MCGIAGLVDLTRGTPEADLLDTARRMARCLTHRGPDDEGSWVDPAAGVALGHRRLSVIDLSEHGHQPMRSPDGRYVVVYNGEIYNYRDLRKDLEGSGTRFRGTSDTEVLLHAVMTWGINAALRRSNGMFALAVWDTVSRRLTLARDRFGEKPLYYFLDDARAGFASETTSLRAWLGRSLEIDRDAVAAYLRTGHVPAPGSIYVGVRKVMPGHMVTLDVESGRVADEPYWSLSGVVAAGRHRPIAATAVDAALDELAELVRDAVDARLIADVPVGALLSGGVDSSLVVATMTELARGPVRTFTVGVEGIGYDEAPQARAVARHMQTEHTEVTISASEALELAPAMPAVYDEPFADSSQLPTFLIARLARQTVTVALTGDGGDEVFGGYARYQMYRRLWSRLSRLPAPVRRGAAAVLRRPSADRWQAVMTPITPLLPGGFRDGHLGEKVHKVADLMRLDSPQALYARLMAPGAAPERLVPGARASDPPPPSPELDFLATMMYLDAVDYLPNDLLVKVDRAAMAVSLETRIPLLDPRIVEFGWRLPAELRIRDGRGKWLLRQLLHRQVPAALVDRPKQGFGVPIGDWLRGPLRGWVEGLLADLLDGDLLDAAAVRRTWEEHLTGVRDRGSTMWSVVMLLGWLDSQRSARQ